MQDTNYMKELWDSLDLKKLHSHIEEGINKRNSNNEIEIKRYIDKIQKEYFEYINMYNNINSLKHNNSTNQRPIIKEGIDDYIIFLKQLESAKILGKAFDKIFN